MSAHEENSVLEQLFFALHQLAALRAIQGVERKADVARMGIVAWYYGVYAAASAMVAAQDGSFQDDHAGTANAWDRHFPARGRIMAPFDLRVSTLVEADMRAEVRALRCGSIWDLNSAATTPSDALGACCAYLSGTAGYYRWRVEEDLRGSKEFKMLGVVNFRTKAARAMRDDRLRRRSVGFLHQAFRYRGKANYREALFLGYGYSTETLLKGYIDDLATVLRAFVAVAGAFASRRLSRVVWDDFINDVDAKRAFSLGPKEVWN